eukprot:TRINITY_DN77153_c0_g1_i1.p1 TRINITY_DN77153_c0_g1~~TRINITY_DN77153_c0_g1_i1.p1  ORF type:complete len:411 (+),score=57.15 TRINITY_DN77153_c0_g1_i1:52-1233(+)
MANRLHVLLRQLAAASGERAVVPACAHSEAHTLPANSVVCVTGAAGFVGSWLVKLLLERGHAVRACLRNAEDERKAGFLKSMPEFKTGRLTLHSADMTKPGTYDVILEGVHTVFHPAEVFMSFSPGRDLSKAAADFGAEVSGDKIHEQAVQSNKYIVNSINKSSTVKRLIYTASVASMTGKRVKDMLISPGVNESHEPDVAVMGKSSYAVTKREAEKFFADAAANSAGKWSVLTVNPSDIIGPIMSPHQATETWQGKIAGIMQGRPAEQEPLGRPWIVVDVRDVAEAEIRLAESGTVESGSRFLVSSGDKILPEDIGKRIMELFPSYDCATTVAPAPGSKKGVVRNHPVWMRIHHRHDLIALAVGLQFRSWDDTLRACVESLTDIGSVVPRLR